MFGGRVMARKTPSITNGGQPTLQYSIDSVILSYQCVSEYPHSWYSCRLTQQLDLKQHALGLLEDRMAGSESAQLAAAADQLKQQLAEAQTAFEGARAKKMELVALAKVGNDILVSCLSPHPNL